MVKNPQEASFPSPVTSMFTVAALLVLGLAPGIYARWSSKKLLSRLEDPLFPELALAHSQRVATVVGTSIALGIVFARSPLLALLALVFVSVLVGGFPARRRIFAEEWSLAEYVGHSTRFWFGVLGSFVLIAAIPSSMSAAGEEASLAVGVALGFAAIVWALAPSFWFRVLLRARPLDAPDVETALAPVLSRARCETPLLFVADARGGSWVNAFALPSVKRGSVLFTRGLAEALTARETAAIFAHEVAHLEHFNRRRVGLGILLSAVLAVIPIALWGGPLAPYVRGWEWLWPLVVLLGLAAKASGQRSHESESDLRALEICQDPDSLISGLTKLHTLLRAPRRWDASYEKMSSHPSLARRIHAIRRAARRGSDEGTIPESFEAIFVAPDGSRSAVLFDPERLHWLRGIPENGEDLLAKAEERRSLRYADLRELRLEGRSEERFLIFTDSAGKTTRMPVSTDSVSDVQSLLDRVDSLVGYETPVEQTPTGRLWSLLLLLLGTVSSFSWAVVVIAALALARPAVGTLLALGSGSLAAALFLALRPGPFAGAGVGWLSLPIALSAGVCLVLAVKRRRAEADRTRSDSWVAALVPAGVVLLSLLGGVGSLMGSLPWAQVHSWASTSPAFVTGLVGLAGALVNLRNGKAYAGAAAALSLSAAFLLLGSSAFRERFSEDVFAQPGTPIPVSDAALEEVRSVVVPGGVFRLALSPEGRKLAAAVVSPDEQRYRPSSLFVEREPGELVPMRAIAFAWADEDRLLVLDENDRRGVLELRTTSGDVSKVIAGDFPSWAGTRIQVDGASGTWQVIGTDWESNELVVIRGTLGSDELEEARRDLEDGSGSLYAVNGNGWTLGPEYEMPDFSDWGESILPYASWFLLSSSASFVTEMKLFRPNEPPMSLGRSMLTVVCFDGGVSELRFFCSASAPESTALWALDPETRGWEPLGSFSGYLYPEEEGRPSEFVLNGSNGPRLVSLERGTALRPVLPEGEAIDAGAWGIVAWRGEVVARAFSEDGDDETTVTLYTLAR